MLIAQLEPKGKEEKMFKCDYCGSTTLPGEKKTMVVTDTRYKEYPPRRDEHDQVIDKGGVGREIVAEKAACVRCSLKNNSIGRSILNARPVL